MKTEDRVDPSKRAFIDEVPGATLYDLFSRLKEEANLTMHFALQFVDYLHEPQLNCRMSVMAASVHTPINGRGELKCVLLTDRQGVDVTPDGDRWAGLISAYGCDDPSW